MKLEELYQQIILDAARERYGEGELAEAHGESHQVNPTCGDEVTMKVRLSEDGERFETVAWEGHGCSISQASISIMTEMIEDLTIGEFATLYEAFRSMMDSRGEELDERTLDMLEDAYAFHGVSRFPMRIKCALLGWMAVRDATDKALAARKTSKERE